MWTGGGRRVPGTLGRGDPGCKEMLPLILFIFIYIYIYSCIHIYIYIYIYIYIMFLLFFLRFIHSTLCAPADFTCGFVCSCVRGKFFLHGVCTILDRLAFGHKLISIGRKCHQDRTRILSKYHANHTWGTPWAGSEPQVAEGRHVGSRWGAH